MSEVILEMRHITKAFSGVKALDDVNLQVKKGEIHALCGENGAGKSTLMNVLSGVYPYGSYEGDIIYKGETCKFHKIKDSENKGIVIIHQELALSPYLSIAENVFMGNERVSMKGVIDWTKTRGEAKEALAHVGLENENLNAPVNTLGVGKQQLIEIAKAMAKNVDLLILDEPTAALNDEESAQLLEIMLELKKKGVTCIIISHKLNEISYVADAITIIRDGKTIETLKKGVDEWTEVVGLAGLMGAGRTEFAMSLFGHSYGQKISGEVYMHGKKVSTKTVKDAINNKIAYTSEDRKTYGLVLIDDIKTNMTMAALRNYYSNGAIVNERKENLEAEEYKKKINVKATSIHQTVGSLSGGNQQKVVLAKWMMTQPDVLILDEPTRGIDVGAKYEIYCAINDMARAGKAVIVISSEMQEIIGTCDRAYIINEGRIAGELSHAELSQESIMKCIMDSNAKGEE